MTREVLVVEDEPDLIATYERLLRRHALETTAARTREAGLAALASSRPHLLIVDLRLPDGDGLDVVRAARSGSAPTPVIVVTGFGSASTRQRALSAGAMAVLDKPFSTEALMHLVRAALPSERP